MMRAVGNHISSSADYSQLRKIRFLSCRNSVMEKKNKIKSSMPGLIQQNVLHGGVSNVIKKKKGARRTKTLFFFV